MRCAYPRCPSVATTGRYCAAHQPPDIGIRGGERRYRTPPRADLQRKSWRRRSRRVRRHPCAHCGGKAEIAHHVVPVSRGGDPDGEVIPLCQRCHNALPAEER